MGLNMFVRKNDHFLVSRGEISNFRQNVISKRLNACLGTKNEVGEGNGLFFQFPAKFRKKGKKGTIYLDFSEKSKFDLFL